MWYMCWVSGDNMLINFDRSAFSLIAIDFENSLRSEFSISSEILAVGLFSMEKPSFVKYSTIEAVPTFSSFATLTNRFAIQLLFLRSMMPPAKGSSVWVENSISLRQNKPTCLNYATKIEKLLLDFWSRAEIRRDCSVGQCSAYSVPWLIPCVTKRYKISKDLPNPGWLPKGPSVLD